MNPVRQSALIAIIYALFGLLWITLSDHVVLGLADNRHTITLLQTWKGWFYVIVTALLVFWLAWRALAVQASLVEELRVSEQRWQFALEGADQGVWDWNMQTNAVFFSPRLITMLGYEVEDFAPHLDAWTSRVHPDDLPLAMAQVDRHRLGECAFYQAEYRMQHKDGRWCWIMDRGKIIERSADGTPLRMIGTHTDITERKLMEEQLRQSAMVYTHSQEGVIITNAEFNIIAVNPAFTIITGYSEQEALGHNPRFLSSGRHSRNYYQSMWQTVQQMGFWQGEIWNRRKSGEIYPEWLTISAVRNERDIITTYVGVFTDITRLKQSEDELEHLAHYDPLTQLPNRLLLLSRLEHSVARMVRQNLRGAVLMLDVDHFKLVNDSLGHTVGDELLCLVAQRLERRLRDADTFARLGGDEFVAVLEELHEPDDASVVGWDLVNLLKGGFTLASGQTLYLGGSVGISVFPDDGTEVDQLLRNADSALNQAKAVGRSTCCFYTQSLTEAASERLVLEADLRHGLEQQEFVLHYQPLIRLRDSAITGFEALVRWQRSDGELVSPARFIPPAEESGLIVPLGEWVLRTACRQMQQWLQQGHGLTTLAVNLSPRQFREPNLAHRVASILSETGLPAACLELEITESAIMEQGLAAQEKMAALKALGVRLAIDDFGTGYSSLAYLKRFPIDKLKIDQSFVRDIQRDLADTEIVVTIIALAHNLRLQVLAEGIETAEQLEFLKRNGCDAGQGFHFSRPVPALEAERLLPAQQRSSQGS